MDPAPSHPDRWTHANALWALFWRMVVLTPFVAVFGSLALAVVLGFTIAPPVLAALWLLNADYLLATGAVIVWVAWLRFGRPVRHFVFQGFEHGSL